MPQYAAVSLLGVLLALLERLAAAICSPFRSRTRQRRPRSAAQSSAWQRFRECSRAPRPVLFHAVISNLGELLWSCLGTPAVTVLKESLAYCLSSFAGWSLSRYLAEAGLLPIALTTSQTTHPCHTCPTKETGLCWQQRRSQTLANKLTLLSTSLLL